MNFISAADEDTSQLADRVALNPAYGTWVNGKPFATHVPGGIYDVGITTVDGRHAVVAVPTDGRHSRFTVASATTRTAATATGIRWCDHANTGAMCRRMRWTGIDPTQPPTIHLDQRTAVTA